LTEKKRSRKPVFFRPDFKKRAVQGRDYLQSLLKKGERFWEERAPIKKKQPKKQEPKPQKGRAPDQIPETPGQEEDPKS